MNTVDWVILGASCSALGLAESLGPRGRVLIIERTAMLAREFVHAFKAGCDWQQAPDSEPATRLKDRLVSQGLLAGDRVSICGAGALFNQAFLDAPAVTRLDCALASVRRENGGFVLELFGAGGFETIRTQRIIDTTTERVALQQRALHAQLVHDQAAFDLPAPLAGITWQPDDLLAPPTLILQLACPVTECLFDARHRLLDAVLALRPTVLAGWRIAAIALSFADTAAAVLSEPETGWYTLPSCGFANPLAAIDGGFRAGKELSV